MQDNVYVVCSTCDERFSYDSKCPKCDRDREGFTDEDRLKKRKKREISYDKDVVLKSRKRSRADRIKKISPFPGRVISKRTSRPLFSD